MEVSLNLMAAGGKPLKEVLERAIVAEIKRQGRSMREVSLAVGLTQNYLAKVFAREPTDSPLNNLDMILDELGLEVVVRKEHPP
jgi:lambda repressor-like predicted transcriptional regulator